jgi:hypothetical protein
MTPRFTSRRTVVLLESIRRATVSIFTPIGSIPDELCMGSSNVEHWQPTMCPEYFGVQSP